MRTCFVWEKLFLEHNMGEFHPESPRRLLAIKEVLDSDGVGKEVERLAAAALSHDEIAYVHEKGYIDHVASTSGREVYLDPDTSTSSATYDAARLAAGGVVQMAKAIWKGDAPNGFAFVRPPGHHAEPDHAMGFCIFNNIAIAAEALRREGADRIAIVDIDVHHGNGTQDHFYERCDVFYASMHRFPFYPGSGSAMEIGDKLGRGFTLNVPLPAGQGDDEFARAINEKIIPALSRFMPSMVLVSAGFDAHVRDPLGGMRATTAGYKRQMKDLADFALQACSGKIMFVLEGGYDLQALKECSEAGLEVLVDAAK